MEEQVLTVEQMQELVDLGIDISTASMCWIGCSDGNDVYPYNSTFKDIFENHKETIPTVLTPTFTLQDILKILPKTIDNFEEYNDTVILTITPDEGWIVGYNLFEMTCVDKTGNTLLEAAFNMLKWCKENNYI